MPTVLMKNASMLMLIDNDKHRNNVSFKIINHSKYNYIFIPYCIENKLGCTTFFQFPKPHSGLSLNNLIFFSSKDSTTYSNDLMGGMSDYHRNTEDGVMFSQKSLNYKTEDINIINPMFVNENILILPAKSTMYYKSFFSLPFNKVSLYTAQEALMIDKQKSYDIALYFRANQNDILKFLHDDLKKTVSQKNFKLFDGELISTNQIPLIIKE